MIAHDFFVLALTSVLNDIEDVLDEVGSIDPTILFFESEDDLSNDEFSITTAYYMFADRTNGDYVFIFKVHDKTNDVIKYIKLGGLNQGFSSPIWYEPEFIEFDGKIMNMSASELLEAVAKSFKESGLEKDTSGYGARCIDRFLVDSNNGDYFGWAFKTGDNNQYYEVIYEDSYGGEGMGEEYWYVVSIIDKDTEIKRYVKFEGTYDSWADTYWETPYYVTPEDVIRTIYRKL